MRVEPRFINRVHTDQIAQIVLSAFDPQTTPRMEGRVWSVSPDVVKDRRTSENFFRVSIDIAHAQLDRLPDHATLIAGMSVEAFL